MMDMTYMVKVIKKYGDYNDYEIMLHSASGACCLLAELPMWFVAYC